MHGGGDRTGVRGPVSEAAAVLDEPSRGPWPGFAWAARAAVEHLADERGMDLWLVTHVTGDDQVVVAAAGAWSEMAAPGAVFSWSESFCRRMVHREGPPVAPDVRTVPAYAAVAVGVLARVQSYVGVPLLTAGGELFGTLCAFAGTAQPEALHASAGEVALVARLLATILAGEELARERSQDAARAYALAERDALTGLRNRRGWDSALEQESERCRRYGCSASVVLVDVGRAVSAPAAAGGAGRGAEEHQDVADAVLTQAASVLQGNTRPGDVVARWGEEFGVLAVESDMVTARALQRRLLVALRSVGVPARAGTATRRHGEGLADTAGRAGAAAARSGRRTVRSG